MRINFKDGSFLLIGLVSEALFGFVFGGQYNACWSVQAFNNFFFFCQNENGFLLVWLLVHCNVVYWVGFVD